MWWLALLCGQDVVLCGLLSHVTGGVWGEVCGEGVWFSFCLFNRLWDCPEGGSSNPGLGSIMSIAACELE